MGIFADVLSDTTFLSLNFPLIIKTIYNTYIDLSTSVEPLKISNALTI